MPKTTTIDRTLRELIDESIAEIDRFNSYPINEGKGTLTKQSSLEMFGYFDTKDWYEVRLVVKKKAKRTFDP